jgi:hypothetical protein
MSPAHQFEDLRSALRIPARQRWWHKKAYWNSSNKFTGIPVITGIPVLEFQ